MSEPKAATTSAEAIASQVANLKDAEVLILRLPERMHHGDAAYRQFAAEMRKLIPKDSIDSVRIIVLRHDMELEQFDAEQLAAVGLALRDSAPGKTPEELFEPGPLRDAAKAAWASAFGDHEQAESRAHVAEEGMRIEKSQPAIDFTHETLRAGGPR